MAMKIYLQIASGLCLSDRLTPPLTAMPQSLSFLLVHLVFSTKDRAGVLDATVRPALHAYLATVARGADCECYRVGGVADHVHLAVRLSRTITTAMLVEELKTSSSKWLKTQSPALTAFSWQRGYGAFSVGPSDLEILRHYIDTQEEHHRRRSFQEEYRGFLTKYGIHFDERYVWD
jgi:putative transposase